MAINDTDYDATTTTGDKEPATKHDVTEGGVLGAVGGAVVGMLAGGPLGAVIGAVAGGGGLGGGGGRGGQARPRLRPHGGQWRRPHGDRLGDGNDLDGSLQHDLHGRLRHPPRRHRRLQHRGL